MDIPIACSLTGAAARSQLGEWRELLATAATGAERVSPTELSCALAGDLDQIESLVRLAQREKACCPFFDFAVQIGAGSLALHVSVPVEAIAVLDDFAHSTLSPAFGDLGVDARR